MSRRPPIHLPLGLALVARFWWLSWSAPDLSRACPRPGAADPGALEAWSFFGLWLGYILTVDALAAWRTGSSPLTRARRDGLASWLALFAISAPAWWLFELLNRFLGNWQYLGVAGYSPLQYALHASISFSTVIPAVLTTAELLQSFGLPPALARWPAAPMSPRARAGWIGLGLALLGGILLAPRYFFPAAWLSVFFIVDPVNHFAGWPSIGQRVARGDWRLVGLLGGAALTCGLFWELWNVYSCPKWVYDVPFVGFGKVFEMPILGYSGYIPFGLELYALYHYARGLAGQPDEGPLAFRLPEAPPLSPPAASP